jgi:lipopolysaccharide transport system ATP-binding protein
MKKAEIVSKMGSIAAFADIGDFFYQPLKMYSSGMLSRLAFAVSAHAEADILIVDEALSVGDAAFGAKCDDYIQNFAAHGTILVVSHDLGTLETLCDRLVWIEDGMVRAIGTPSDLIPEYREVMERNRT